MSDLPKPPKVPCASCPYRRDVPSGVWDVDEYVKLPNYDGEIVEQAMVGAGGLFMCHQKDGCLCGGWLKTHGVDNLLALRINAVDDSVWDYDPPTPVFRSGAEAAHHGLQDIETPSDKAHRVMESVSKLQERRKA